jgi:hypothetical protein
MRELACSVPFALEGMLRREIESAGATLLGATHGEQVMLQFSLSESATGVFQQRIDHLGQGRVAWLETQESPPD